MSRPRQSRALIIVNTDFCSSDGDVGLRPRRGARREAEKLSRVLAQLSYRVKLLHNRTAKEMEDLYQQECSREHGDYFVSVISSHGEEGAVLGCDCRPLRLTRIFHIVSAQNCPALAERPKVFFIQACRGAALDQGVFVETDSGQPEPASFSEYLHIPPNTAVMFACSPGPAGDAGRGGALSGPEPYGHPPQRSRSPGLPGPRHLRGLQADALLRHQPAAGHLPLLRSE